MHGIRLKGRHTVPRKATVLLGTAPVLGYQTSRLQHRNPQASRIQCEQISFVATYHHVSTYNSVLPLH